MNSAIASGLSVPKGGPNVGAQKACVLDGAALDLNQLREDNRLELLEILDSIGASGSKKCLILDAQLVGRLNHILVEGPRVLRENGVSSFRELRGDTIVEQGDDIEHYVYLCRAHAAHMYTIAKQIKAALRARFIAEDAVGDRKRFHMLMVPRKTYACSMFLEDLQVDAYVSVSDFHLDLVAFDKDVLSLEVDSCYRDNKIHGDPTSLEFVVQSLLKLENFFGKPKRMRGLGPLAKGVLERLARQRYKMYTLKMRERGYYGSAAASARLFGSKPPPPPVEADLDSSTDWELLVLDREVDLVTPLVTPLTYEGLIDELIGIKNSTVKLPADVVGDEQPVSSTPADQLTTVALNSNEALYAEIRNLNVEGLGSHLGDRAKLIRGSYDEFRGNRDASITEIHEFVKRIPSLTRDYKALQMHINVVEKLKKTTDSRQFRERWNTERSMLEGDVIYETLEDLIYQQTPLMLALRFLSIQSLVSGGIRTQKKFDDLRRAVMHEYGFELLPTLHNLDKAGLFRRKAETTAGISMIAALSSDASSTFAALRKHLHLIIDDVDPVRPRDVAYVSSGYAPLSVRLVEAKAWSPQLLANLPGPALDYRLADFDPKVLVDHFKQSSPDLYQPPPPDGASAPKRPLVVYFVGGVTYAEIAAFRFLSKQPNFPYTIIVATTAIINGSTFIKSLVFEIDNRLQKVKPSPSLPETMKSKSAFG